MHLWRFKHPDLTGWPSKDAFFILVTEIILMGLFLSMNATDTILQCKAYGHYADQITGNFIVSSLLHPLFIGF